MWKRANVKERESGWELSIKMMLEILNGAGDDSLASDLNEEEVETILLSAERWLNNQRSSAPKRVTCDLCGESIIKSAGDLDIDDVQDGKIEAIVFCECGANYSATFDLDPMSLTLEDYPDELTARNHPSLTNSERSPSLVA